MEQTLIGFIGGIVIAGIIVPFVQKKQYVKDKKFLLYVDLLDSLGKIGHIGLAGVDTEREHDIQIMRATLKRVRDDIVVKVPQLDLLGSYSVKTKVRDVSFFFTKFESLLDDLEEIVLEPSFPMLITRTEGADKQKTWCEERDAVFDSFTWSVSDLASEMRRDLGIWGDEWVLPEEFEE